jgi:DNA transformation protein and related proteins
LQNNCMPARNAYLGFLLEQMAPLGDISSRAMMGGYCLYCDGIVFALVARGALFLKADDVNRGAFTARGLKAFRPFEDQNASMSYYEAPPEIFEDPDAMREWCGGAVQAGRRAQEKKKGKARGKRAKT